MGAGRATVTPLSRSHAQGCVTPSHKKKRNDPTCISVSLRSRCGNRRPARLPIGQETLSCDQTVGGVRGHLGEVAGEWFYFSWVMRMRFLRRLEGPRRHHSSKPAAVLIGWLHVSGRHAPPPPTTTQRTRDTGQGGGASRLEVRPRQSSPPPARAAQV